MDSEDDDAPNAAPEHVRIPANVPVYYLEELCEIIPTQVMYIHNDECWWNLAFFHDELARRLPSEERMNKFVKTVGDLLSQESVVEYVGQALYVKPSNTQPGWGFVKKNVKYLLRVKNSKCMICSHRKPIQLKGTCVSHGFLKVGPAECQRSDNKGFGICALQHAGGVQNYWQN